VRSSQGYLPEDSSAATGAQSCQRAAEDAEAVASASFADVDTELKVYVVVALAVVALVAAMELRWAARNANETGLHPASASLPTHLC